MLNWIDDMYINAKVRMYGFVNELKNDESGVSGFVATIMLIIIAVLAAGIVWNWLGGDDGYFNKLFEKVEGLETPK